MLWNSQRAQPPLLSFFVVASGGIGSIAGGIVADRIGRAATAAAMVAVSRLCVLTTGLTFAGPLWLFAAIAMRRED